MAMSRLDGCRSLTLRPPMRISPAVICSSPAMVLSRVDLPQPDGPTRTRNPPFSICSEMPFRIRVEPNDFSRLLISRKDISLPLDRAGHQTANEVASGDDVDDEGGEGRQDRPGEMDVVLLHPGRGVHQIVERHGDRDRIDAGERRPEQEIVP